MCVLNVVTVDHDRVRYHTPHYLYPLLLCSVATHSVVIRRRVYRPFTDKDRQRQTDRESNPPCIRIFTSRLPGRDCIASDKAANCSDLVLSFLFSYNVYNKEITIVIIIKFTLKVNHGLYWYKHQIYMR